MSAASNVIALAAFYYDVEGALKLTTDKPLLFRDGRQIIALAYRASSADEAWRKAEQLADKNLAVRLRKFTTLEYNVLQFNPVGRITGMVADDPASAILVINVPGDQVFIIVQAINQEIAMSDLPTLLAEQAA